MKTCLPAGQLLVYQPTFYDTQEKDRAVPLWEEFQYTPLAFAITAGVAGMVIVPLFFLARSRRLLPLQRFRLGQWTAAEVWIPFLVWYLAPALAVALLKSIGVYDAIFEDSPAEEPSSRLVLWASPLALLLTLAILFYMLFLMSGTRPSQLGLSLARWPQNCLLGYLGFLTLTPLILGLNLLNHLVFRWLDVPPRIHPLEELGQKSLLPVEWGLIYFSVSISAPIWEELYFRGILQGWIRRASFLGHASVKQKAIVAIVGSSLLWAAAHFQAWPDPIPLFFLGLGLGFLAYRTQNLLPGIVLHGLFNTVAFLELLLPKVNN